MEKSIEEYKREMLEMHKKSKPVFESENKVKSDIKSDEMGSGKIIIEVTTAHNLYPIDNATVTISDKNGNIIKSEKTNRSGKTPGLIVSAPPKSKTESPGAQPIDVSSFYDAKIEAEGFITTILKDISVFDGVTSIQQVNMLLTAAASDKNQPQIIQFSNQYEL